MSRVRNMMAASLAMGVGIGIGQGLVSRPHSAAWAQEGVTEGRYNAATAEETNVIRIVRQSMPAVVSISEGDSEGSGVLIRENGLILTNAHVLEGTDKVHVRLADGRRFNAQVVGSDTAADIAVLKIPGKGLPWLASGDSDHLEVGQTAIAIGDPMGLDRTVTKGVVSGLDRQVEDLGLDHMIQTDAGINPGSSGGPLLDSHGDIIGINAVGTEGEQANGLSFAIPINNANNVARTLMKTGTIQPSGHLHWLKQIQRLRSRPWSPS